MDLALLVDEGTVREAWQHHEVSKTIGLNKRLLLNDDRRIDRLPGDHGPFDEQTVSNAVKGSKNLLNCLRLCNTAHAFGENGAVELGTNLGVSSAYLALGCASWEKSSTVVTGEASGARIEIAKELHRKCRLTNIQYVHGYFEDTLTDIYDSLSNFRLAFIDGDHTYGGTLRYYEEARIRMPAESLIIFDDIDWSDGMRRAWAEISSDNPSLHTLTLDGMGYLIT